MGTAESVLIREANLTDILGIVEVRGAVKENILTTHIPVERVADGLEARGRGWVAEHAGRVVGFSMADREESMIWRCSCCRDGRAEAWASGCSNGPSIGCGRKAAR